MKTKDFVKELNNKSVDELNNELVAAKKELFNLRFQNAQTNLRIQAELKKLEEILHVFRVQLQQKQTLSNHFERRNLLWKEI